jgi:hypothetical protein
MPEATLNLFIPENISLGEREEELVNKICTLYSNTINSAFYQNKLKEWNESHEIYLSKVTPTSWPWPDACNIDLGIIEMVVDNIKSRFKLSTIGAKPMFNLIPTTPEGEEKKEWVTDNMNFILDEDIDIEKKIDDIAQNTVEYGTCIAKIYWQKTLQETRQYTSVDEILIPDLVEEIKEKGELDVVDLTNVIVPEGAGKDLQKLPWLFHRIWYSLDELKKKVKIGFYAKEKIEIVEAGLRETKEATAKTPEEKLQVITKLPEEQIEILECYMRYDADNDGLEEECIFWICPSTRTYLKGHYLRDIFFDGRRPFYRFVYKETGSFYGRGIPQMLKYYREAINNIFNFGINSAYLQILPWGFYRIGSSFKPEEVKLAPGTMIPVDDINDVRIASFPQTSTLAEGIVMLLMTFVERQTGISAPHMGKEFPTRKTATEVRTIISEGNIKHEDRIASFQDIFSDCLKGIYHLYRQNQPLGKQIRIPDETMQSARFVPAFSALDQLSDYDFVILGTLTTGNKVTEREDTMGLYALASKHPLLAEYPSGQLELLKELFNTFGKRNIKRFLPPDEVIRMMTDVKLREVIAMLQQQMMKMGAGAPPTRPEEMVSPGLYPGEAETPEAPPETGLPVQPQMSAEGQE